jgi:DNA-directed RNA polymerase subunit E'
VVQVKKMKKMMSGDGSTHYKVQFDALTFYLKLLEIVRGQIVEITDFGAIVN